MRDIEARLGGSWFAQSMLTSGPAACCCICGHGPCLLRCSPVCVSLTLPPPVAASSGLGSMERFERGPTAIPLRLPADSHAGVEKLCKDLKVDPTDRLVLLLAWKVRGPLPAHQRHHSG